MVWEEQPLCDIMQVQKWKAQEGKVILKEKGLTIKQQKIQWNIKLEQLLEKIEYQD